MSKQGKDKRSSLYISAHFSLFGLLSAPKFKPAPYPEKLVNICEVTERRTSTDSINRDSDAANMGFWKLFYLPYMYNKEDA